ncbi:hypothetical protein [Bacillus swezeyi]|uniref:Uncharacterized protein n=1 Tax=Bacillus swezeyi TaxID=1925020 RepID=A0A5M8RYV9_9BACI|nr:hypothetical protein [Bacillus swezeyi]KAA6451002.1 hypothetical protein DX927_09240 [Bacillus swezeyi]
MKKEEQRNRIESNATPSDNPNIEQLANQIDVLIFYKSLDSFAVTFYDMHSFSVDDTRTPQEQVEDFCALNSLLHSEREE